MKKAIIVSVITSLSVMGLSTGTASAWHYGITGSGVCQTDGSYKITWKVDNSSEPTALDVKTSSSPSVVPTGKAIVPAKQSKSFTQTVSGISTGEHKLELVASWDGDRNDQKQSAKVKLEKACKQPVKPEEPKTPTTPEPGRGGGEVLSEITQVTVAPVGAVNAGNGNSAMNIVVAVTGLIVSAAAVIFSVIRVAKNRA